ncbi:hypothetical protein GBN32_17425 [Plesiomonas shigelloides]|uniref:hypothetical protein n=1 Tax=Plesiomonas shigelloides TaxID=703 RepID=UPI0012619188|nr:hypothetical protein [Plesiomonas shigelloides]KAB7704652.1 hypothetical protein GBN32_17425 [Plesiomonas shigelloides]
MNEVFNYFTKDELNVISVLISFSGVLINIFILAVAYRALSSWRYELNHNDRNQVITFLFDDVKKLHADFISLIVLQSKYLQQMSDADNDPVAHLRNHDKFNDPEILAKIEFDELGRIQRDLKEATVAYLLAHDKYTIKLISLSSYLIPLKRYPLKKTAINKITESIHGLSDASYSCFEFFDKKKDITRDLYLVEVNKVNAKYFDLLVDLDSLKGKMLNE